VEAISGSVISFERHVSVCSCKNKPNDSLMKLFALGFLISTALTPLQALAVPIRPTEPVTLKGEIVDWVWRGAMHYAQEQEGWWFEGDKPAHYLLLLNVQNGDAEKLKRVTWIVSTMPVGHRIMREDFKPTQVLLLIPSERLKEIRRGATFEITNYSLSGDERDTAASFGMFTVDGKKPTSAGPLFPDVPSTKKSSRPKSSGLSKRAKKRD
jgi:hypothetical protein